MAQGNCVKFYSFSLFLSFSPNKQSVIEEYVPEEYPLLREADTNSAGYIFGDHTETELNSDAAQAEQASKSEPMEQEEKKGRRKGSKGERWSGEDPHAIEMENMSIGGVESEADTEDDDLEHKLKDENDDLEKGHLSDSVYNAELARSRKFNLNKVKEAEDSTSSELALERTKRHRAELRERRQDRMRKSMRISVGFRLKKVISAAQVRRGSQERTDDEAAHSEGMT